MKISRRSRSSLVITVVIKLMLGSSSLPEVQGDTESNNGPVYGGEGVECLRLVEALRESGVVKSDAAAAAAAADEDDENTDRRLKLDPAVDTSSLHHELDIATTWTDCLKRLDYWRLKLPETLVDLRKNNKRPRHRQHSESARNIGAGTEQIRARRVADESQLQPQQIKVEPWPSYAGKKKVKAPDPRQSQQPRAFRFFSLVKKRKRKQIEEDFSSSSSSSFSSSTSSTSSTSFSSSPSSTLASANKNSSVIVDSPASSSSPSKDDSKNNANATRNSSGENNFTIRQEGGKSNVIREGSIILILILFFLASVTISVLLILYQLKRANKNHHRGRPTASTTKYNSFLSSPEAAPAGYNKQQGGVGGQSPGAGYHYDDDDDDDRCNGCRLHPADAANIGDNEKSGKIVGKSKKTKATKSVIKPKKVKKSKKKGVKGKKKGNAPKFTGSELLEIRQKIANILATATGCDTGGGGGGGTLTSSHDGGDHLNDDHRYYADCCHNLHHDTINAAEDKSSKHKKFGIFKISSKKNKDKDDKVCHHMKGLGSHHNHNPKGSLKIKQ